MGFALVKQKRVSGRATGPVVHYVNCSFQMGLLQNCELSVYIFIIDCTVNALTPLFHMLLTIVTDVP